jgi:alkaline phosphatase
MYYNFRTLRTTFLILAISCLFFSGSIFAQTQEKLPHPKNVILMIGDGMGFNHILATDYYFGSNKQVYENFPVRVAMAHYPAKGGEYEEGNPGSNYYTTGYNTVAAWSDTAYLKRNFTESAAAATAMATGFKTYNNSIGLSVNYDTLENLTELAKSLGKSAGVVTSVEFSHATPAGFVAHNKVRINYRQIAYQMLLKSRCDVIMGCGDPSFDDNGHPLTKKWKDSRYVGDSAFWVQLIEGSGKTTQFTIGGKNFSVNDVNGDGSPDPWTVVRNTEDFRNLMNGPTPERVLGCPKIYSTLQQSRVCSKEEQKDSPPYTTHFVSGLPTLAEMSGGALNVLSKNDKGFFVMIEGGAIDWACHSNQKGRLIEEMNSFNEAVEKVVEWVNTNSNWDETLLIITGDHETGLLWGGVPFKAIVDKGSRNLPEMKFYSTNHSNSLIALFAKGAGSEWFQRMADEYDRFRGPFIQNSEIPQLVHFLWAK